MKISEIINELTELKELIGDKELEACMANSTMTCVNIMYKNDDGGITSTSLEGEKLVRSMDMGTSKLRGCNGIAVNFNVMLGDGDGNYKEEVLFPKHVIDDFVKYFDDKGWGKEPVELIELEHEFIPGGSIYSDQILKLFKQIKLGSKCNSISTESKYSYANFNYTVGVADVNEAEWVPYDDGSGTLFDEIEKASEAADDLREFFIDIYFRYVLPFIKEDKFETADSLGTYRIYAR